MYIQSNFGEDPIGHLIITNYYLKEGFQSYVI